MVSLQLCLTADKNPATGTDTLDSSEAVLRGVALKRRWQAHDPPPPIPWAMCNLVKHLASW